MASEGSQIDCDLNIYFVITRIQKSEDECSNDMWQAFNNCEEHELGPKWIHEKMCDDSNPGKKDVFVMEEFEGPTFDKLASFKCSVISLRPWTTVASIIDVDDAIEMLAIHDFRAEVGGLPTCYEKIVGPRCLLSCFMTGEPIPEGTNPVFTTAMRGLVICVSGLSAEAKAEIARKVEYMGGVFTKQFRSSVTHLIANVADSSKYEAAVDLKVPIMTERWVKAVWEASLKENVLATSSKFDRHKCPPFLNLFITSTNLSKDKRAEVKKLINSNGGTYMGCLDGEKVKIVIAPANSVLSDKLKFAFQNNIPCVTTNWITDSIKQGHALPSSEYPVNPIKGCSTPETLHENATLNFSCMSTIPDTRGNGVVNETMMTTMSSTMQQSILELKAAYVEVLARLNPQEAKMAGPFLDGCKIYSTGFPPDHREKLNRILNVGSATRLDNISEAVTHVIVGDPSKAAAELKLIKSKGLSPYFVTINWLEESMKLKCTAIEDDFKYESNEGASEQKKIEPPSPLSKKNLQLLQKPRRPPVPLFDIDKKSEPVKEMEEPDLIKEYRKSNLPSAGDTSLQKFLEPHNESRPLEMDKNKSAKNAGNVSNNTTIGGNDERRVSGIPDDTTVPLTQPSDANEQIFAGLTFVLSGFDGDDELELAGNIEALGGRLVSKAFKGIPDYGVVPLFGASLKHTVNEIVTDLFIEDCIEHEALIEINYYHRPVTISKDSAPLVGLVIAMSNYTGKERTFLTHVTRGLGARSQDTFARRTYLNKDTYGCTHLICPIPEGGKYAAAVKWKLPAVTADWMLECLAQDRRVDETPYLVGETIAPERPTEVQTGTPKHVNADSQMGPPSGACTRPILTPKRQLPVSQESGVTPLQTPTNKRLSIGSQKTPLSPFHVSTPETPYGQGFKPNPDSSTRKRWLKWSEDIPDIRVREPPYKRRAPSTPLSELKRQLSKALTDPEYLKNESEVHMNGQRKESTVTAKPSQDKVTTCSPLPSNKSVEKAQSFRDENVPARTEEINLQLAQLDQVLQASTHETRHSLSSESAKQVIYDSEPVDHLAKCPVPDSQPDTVGWKDPVHTAIRRKSTIPEEAGNDSNADKSSVEKDMEEEVPKKPKFMLSGTKDRSGYENIIIALGGDVSMESGFDPTATHLISMKPSRNEKFLCSIAAGKWVLHHLYLKDSEQQGVFLDEEKYEWGNPKSRDTIPQPTSETDNQIAAAAYRCRLRLLENPNGAFHDMVALLVGPKEKCLQYKRLICVGGGTVVEARPPYNTSPKSKKITHCFIQVKQVDQPVDWAMMASKGILCFFPQYLSDQLTAKNPLNPKDCVLPEFRKYLSLLPK